MNAKLRTLLRFSAAFAIAASFAASSRADSAGTDDMCVQQGSPPRDTLICGRLANGMRYIIQKNVTPPGTASIRLMIGAGSMQEADDQHGIAHFLEHIAFRGSTHVADGEMMRTLQRLGARFGADVNASTNSTSTIYSFDLAKNDDASIDTGLMFAREIGSELTLDPKALASERNVVLAEARGQNPIGRAAYGVVIKSAIGDHPFGRPTIGTEQEIETDTAERMRDFYNAYYRPERAVLIVAGDLDVSSIEAKIRKDFGDWQTKGAAGGDPAPARPPTPREQVAVVAGLSGTFLRLRWAEPYRQPVYNHDERLRDWIEYLGETSLMQRIRDQNTVAGLPMTFFDGFSRDDISGVSRGVLMSAHGIRDPSASVKLVLEAWRRFLQYGLTQQEIDRNAAIQRSNLVAANTVKPTPVVVLGIEFAILAKHPYEIPQQSLAEFDEATHNLTAARVDDILRASVVGAEPMVVYLGPTSPVGGEPALRDAVSTVEREQLSPYTVPEVKPWTHTNFGPPGTVAERRTDDALGVTFVHFANNVRLSVKPTQFEPGIIHVAVRFGHGLLDLPRDKVDASNMAAFVLIKSGLDDMTVSELVRSLTGQHVMALASMNDDAFVLGTDFRGTSTTPSKTLDFEMQLLAAKISAPGWQVEGWDNELRSQAMLFPSRQANPIALFANASREALHPGDARWVLATPDVQRDWKVADAIAFIKPILANAPLQVVIVGDVTVDKAIDATARTLGAVAARSDIPEPAALRKANLPPPTAKPNIVRHSGPSDQAMIGIAWPGTDAYSDPRLTEAGQVLVNIMRSRAFDELRVKQGKAYSPQAAENFSLYLPDYGTISMWVAVKPEDVNSAFATMDGIAADLVAHEVSSDEFQRTLAPIIESAARVRETNGYWIGVLSDAYTDPRRLDLSTSTIPIFKSLTPTDVRAAAQRLLIKERSMRMAVIPQ